MKATIMLAILVCVCSLVVLNANAEVPLRRSKRLSCNWFGTSGCMSSCILQGKPRGGCCGRSGRCKNICYCYGSGYEYRCYRCDL